ncbi:hypothetical protein I7I53_11529 [Histoplasma capsulatum var. duboisii H88]|uniref:Uncharacterized protein n=1 Tax=Ajellomyces capsulatus (strain H88) TaxID=544711 RepID=A0A8A1LZK8_AJEC8|nr:hypothetical protein I7I53_11529 [Histoplasma capsulatum var. duboisii H88]
MTLPFNLFSLSFLNQFINCIRIVLSPLIGSTPVTASFAGVLQVSLTLYCKLSPLSLCFGSCLLCHLVVSHSSPQLNYCTVVSNKSAY